MAMDKELERVYGGRTKQQWFQLIGFYTVFYGWLIAMFAICYVVMFNTLPSETEGPKLSNLIEPGAVTVPGDINLNAMDLAASSRGALRSLQNFGRSSSVNLGDTARFGACEATLSGEGNTTYSQLQPCLFARLNRVFNFPSTGQTIAVSTVLDFPSEAEFENRYGVSFQDFKTNSISVTPSSIVAAAPFTNSGNFQDIVSAIQLDLTALGSQAADFRLGVQFDFGQPQLEEDNGYTTFDVTLRQ